MDERSYLQEAQVYMCLCACMYACVIQIGTNKYTVELNFSKSWPNVVTCFMGF